MPVENGLDGADRLGVVRFLAGRRVRASLSAAEDSGCAEQVEGFLNALHLGEQRLPLHLDGFAGTGRADDYETAEDGEGEKGMPNHRSSLQERVADVVTVAGRRDRSKGLTGRT